MKQASPYKKQEILPDKLLKVELNSSALGELLFKEQEACKVIVKEHEVSKSLIKDQQKTIEKLEKRFFLLSRKVLLQQVRK